MSLHFEPIHLDQLSHYNERYEQSQVPASDYTFVNLWGWADEYGLEWAWTDELTWIRQARPQLAYWAPVGNWRKVDWEKTFSQLPTDLTEFTRVPKILHQIWQERLPINLTIKETKGQWDYIYDVKELVELRGNRFHKKKNLVNQFKKKYPYQYLPFCNEMIDHAMALQAEWCKWKDCEANETLAMENRVIERVLQHIPDLKQLTGGALLVDDILVSYTIAEVVLNDIMIIHFEKGDPEYKGSYQAINQMFLEQSGQECSYVNREQDLDDPGLRKAKLSYQPIEYIPKNKVYID